MMKTSFEDRTSPDVSTDASVSDQSKFDQEMGSNTTSSSEDVFTKKVDSSSQLKIDRILIRKVVAEAVGTFILMFSVCGIIASMQLMRVEVGLMEYAATAALAVIIVVFSTGAISGAHVNPAVTIAFATVGPFPWSKVPFYVMAQVVGSTLATYAGRFVYGMKSELMMTTPLHGRSAAFWVELIATFIILFLVASLSHDPKSVGQLSGFVIGAAIGLGVLISGPVSGGSMNPARSLGPALVSWNFDNIWIYLLAPTIGAIGGVTLYRSLRLQGWSCSPSSSPDTHLLNHSLH